MNRDKLLLWCIRKCNNPLLEDTGGFSFVLDQLLEIFERTGISSESIDGLSQSFSSDINKEIRDLLSPYRKARFI